MGKQIEFYMTHSDELAFLKALRKRSNLTVIYNTFTNPDEKEIDVLSPVGTDPYDADLSLVNGEVDRQVVAYFVPEQSIYAVDLLESEAIQFNRCSFVNTWLRNGRIWFEENSEGGPKNPDFVRWARWVIEWIRRSYRLGDDGRYVGPDAFTMASDGALVLGPPTKGVSADEFRKLIDKK